MCIFDLYEVWVRVVVEERGRGADVAFVVPRVLFYDLGQPFDIVPFFLVHSVEFEDQLSLWSVLLFCYRLFVWRDRGAFRLR